jgi:uncharacterized protein
MILKLIIFAAIGIFIYKLLGGRLPTLGTKQRKPKEKRPDSDTLVECSRCSTYVTIEESILVNGKYYCDECA